MGVSTAGRTKQTNGPPLLSKPDPSSTPCRRPCLPSKRRSSPGAEASSGISQARLMDKLAQPKLPSLEEEQQQQQQQQSMNSADAGRSARRPSLKRRVKSQGDIPESGFPLLPRRRRTGPASAATTRVRAGERVADGATRRTLPPGPPMRSAWPLQEDGRGMVPRRYGGSVEKLQDGGGGGGDGGGGDEGDIRSTANISAIEAMLEEGGGDAYLPARARDLPEAVAILGPSSPGSSSSSRKGRPRGTEKTTRGSRCGGDTNNAREQDDQSPEGNESLDAPSENNRSADGRTERTSCSGIASSREKRCDGAEERFLHPWQRALEASKRAIKSRAEEHEAALLREKRRRSEARRAAAVSEDCQKARRRVAARLGRTKQRRHRHRHRHRRSAESSHDVVRGRKRQTPQLELGRESTRFNIVGEDWEGSRGSSGGEARLREAARRQHTGDCGDGSHDHDGYLHQMRDALGWARRTLAALVQRLRDRGVGIDKPAVSVADGERPAKDWEVVRVVNKLRRRLAAFEDVEKTAATTAAAGAADGSRGPAVVGESSEFLLLRTRCEAACESFEIEFGHMIDELIATAKAHPSNLNLHLSHVEGDTDGGDNSPILTPSTAGSKDVDDHQPPGASSAASAATQQPTRTVGTATFGLCPSCSVLPVARRCLGCEGSHADRSRCSSCFVREHREPPRHLHRFLRISGGSGDAQDASGDGGGDRAWPKQHLGVQGGDNARVGNSETQGNGSGSGAGAGAGARCSRCGDLAAARRCRECRVDACAACHFLAHRSPSRRSHVVEFVGETAVAVQETLHSRNQLQSVAAAAAAAAAAVDGGRGEEGAGDEGAVGPATFGEDAAQSLAQVRRTIDAPVVRPRSQASTERGSVSFGRDDGDGGSSECSQEQDLSDEAKSGGETSAEGATGSARDDREGEQGEQGDEVSGVTQDIVRGGSDATATATFGGFIEGGDDNSSDGSEGRPNRDADPRQGGRHVGRARYAQGVLEGIHEEREDELEQEQEGSADSSVYSSSDEDTDDEGMVRNRNSV